MITNYAVSQKLVDSFSIEAPYRDCNCGSCGRIVKAKVDTLCCTANNTKIYFCPDCYNGKEFPVVSVRQYRHNSETVSKSIKKHTIEIITDNIAVALRLGINGYKRYKMPNGDYKCRLEDCTSRQAGGHVWSFIKSMPYKFSVVYCDGVAIPCETKQEYEKIVKITK